MSSLTEVAYMSRRLIKYGGLGLLALVLIWSIGGAILKAYRRAHPPYIAPTVRYGVLDKVVFPEKSFEKKNFSAEMPNDVFPQFKDQANVYVIYQSQSTIGALDEGKKTAAKLGFSGEPREINNGLYLFTDPGSNRNLVMNVLENSFKMNYPYLADPLLLNPEEMPSTETAIRTAKSFLEQADKFSSDLEGGQNKVSFWEIKSEGLRQVESLAQAQIVRVDFFRKDFEDGLKVVSTEPDVAGISVLVSGSSINSKKIVEVNYKHVEVDTSANSSSTYPIISSEEAFEQLKAGNYWPAKDVEGANVVIRKLYLAYFEPVNLTHYLQPIYVFEGDKGFVAYVRAVSDKYAK